jgi:hypothetical protein
VECVQTGDAVKTDSFAGLVFYPRHDNGHIVAEYVTGGSPFEIAFMLGFDLDWEIAD